MFLSDPLYQALRDYQSTDASIIHPPWCITVQASGHTFAPNTEPFFPKLIFDTKNLLFPATVSGCPVYRTAVLKNTGDTPILFDFSHDPSEYVLHKLIPRPCGRRKFSFSYMAWVHGYYCIIQRPTCTMLLKNCVSFYLQDLHCKTLSWATAR